VKIKGYVVVAVLTAFVSWLIFSPDDDTRDGEATSPESTNGMELRVQPREPGPGPRTEPYGVAGGGDLRETPARDREAPPRYPPRSYRPSAPRMDSPERFSFRPLTERERERLQADRPAPTYYPESPLPGYPPAPYSQALPMPAPAPESRPWAGYGDPDDVRRPHDGGYGYRPGSRADSYPAPWYYGDSPSGDWRSRVRPDAASPWSDPASPQWGSTPPEWAPPEDRMYPSLVPYPDRKLTARH
jgi:hypothetical protein